jgi:hypothetical protein
VELDAKLCKKGYKQLEADPCIYIWHTHNDFVIITVWVDNLLIFAMSVKLKNKVISNVKEEWEITDLGEPSKIIGIEITCTEDSITISLSKYIDSILFKEGLRQASLVSTPLDPNVPIEPNLEGNKDDRSNSYMHLLGELQYIANAI